MADLRLLDTAAKIAATQWAAITGLTTRSPQWDAVRQVLTTCGLLDDSYTLFTVDDTRAAWKHTVCLLAGAHYAIDHGVDNADATEIMATLISDFYGIRDDTPIEQMIPHLRAEVPLRLLGIHHTPGDALRDALSNADRGRRDKLATLVLHEATDNEGFCIRTFDRLAADPQFGLKLARTCGGRWIVYRNNP